MRRTNRRVHGVVTADRGTLQEIDVWSIDSTGFGGASAWAFAFWGGRYYVFYQGLLDSSTGIYRVTPTRAASSRCARTSAIASWALASRRAPTVLI